MNNENNKLLAGLVGVPCYHEGGENLQGYYHCPKCLGIIPLKFSIGIEGLNTDYFADPPHSKLVELSVALRKWAKDKDGQTQNRVDKIRSMFIDTEAQDFALAIVNLIKEQDAK